MIAEIENQPIGAIWLRLFDEAQEIGMAVLKEFRGRGIENRYVHVGWFEIYSAMEKELV